MTDKQAVDALADATGTALGEAFLWHLDGTAPDPQSVAAAILAVLPAGWRLTNDAPSAELPALREEIAEDHGIVPTAWVFRPETPADYRPLIEGTTR